MPPDLTSPSDTQACECCLAFPGEALQCCGNQRVGTSSRLVESNTISPGLRLKPNQEPRFDSSLGAGFPQTGSERVAWERENPPSLPAPSVESIIPPPTKRARPAPPNHVLDDQCEAPYSIKGGRPPDGLRDFTFRFFSKKFCVSHFSSPCKAARELRASTNYNDT